MIRNWINRLEVDVRDEVIKYYVWKDNERFTEEAFDDIDEAI